VLNGMIWNNWLISGVYFSLVSRVVLDLFFLYLALQRVMKFIRNHVAALEDDRYLADNIKTVNQLVLSSQIISSLDDDNLIPELYQ